MKIFGLVLSRTGTTTLTEVLNSVGYNIIHYTTNKNLLFDSSNDGVTDIISLLHYKEVDKKLDCKFIWTHRDKEEWLEAAERYFVRKESWGWSEDNPQMQLRKNIYSSFTFNKDIFSDAYDRHYNDVMDYFKDRPKDFLFLNIIGGDSPTKLAEFLSIDQDKFPKEFPVQNKLNIQ